MSVKYIQKIYNFISTFPLHSDHNSLSSALAKTIKQLPQHYLSKHTICKVFTKYFYGLYITRSKAYLSSMLIPLSLSWKSFLSINVWCCEILEWRFVLSTIVIGTHESSQMDFTNCMFLLVTHFLFYSLLSKQTLTIIFYPDNWLTYMFASFIWAIDFDFTWTQRNFSDKENAWVQVNRI